jgi:hypothetical protein
LYLPFLYRKAAKRWSFESGPLAGIFWHTIIMHIEEGRCGMEVIILDGDVRLDVIEQEEAGAWFF